MYNIGEIQLPLLIGKKRGGNIDVDRYAGVGFYLNDNGLIATCEHVLNSVGDSEILMAKDLSANQIYVVNNIQIHPTKDFGVCEIKNGGNICLTHHDKEIITGEDVSASGFTNNGKNGSNVLLDLRFFKGYIVRTSSKPIRPESNSTCEISFPALKGFSGVPLISQKHGGKLVGMIYGNIESTIQLYSLVEFKEDGKELREEIHKVMELGLAHTVTDIKLFMKDMGIS